jgi:DNA methylase/Restriction endonuclease
MKGQDKKCPDFWDIPTINNMAKERLGYPTQKPEELLERIVKSSSEEGDLVLDPFAGCGTTLVAAQRLKRKWIGMDISPTAVNLMVRRMGKVGVTPQQIQLAGLPVSVDDLRTLKPFEFQNWVIQRFNGTFSPRKSGDMGIDGLSFFHHHPIQVKQSEHVGRNVVDNFETAIERAGSEKGYIVAFSFTKGAYEEAARAKGKAKVEIVLVTVEELLAKVPDLAEAAGQMFEELPLPSARPSDALPSAEDLISSDESN